MMFLLRLLLWSGASSVPFDDVPHPQVDLSS
jgi:hypothetical protein